LLGKVYWLEDDDSQKKKGAFAKSFNQASRSIAGEAGFQIAFGNQTIFLPSIERKWKILGFASLPRGRFAFFGAIVALKELPWNQAGLTALNILNQ
jgi:hypothetical protein